MDELMMYEYLKNKQIEDKEFLDKFKSFMGQHKSYMRNQKEYPYSSYREDYDMDDWDSYKSYPSNMGSFSKEFERNNMYKYMRHNLEQPRLTEEEAKHLVSKMYHVENNRKYIGEKYDMYKSKEICQRYKGIIPHTTTLPEVYLALNTHYHNYAELFNKWFGDNSDPKIIESAILFWFKDHNYHKENKVIEYFREY